MSVTVNWKKNEGNKNFKLKKYVCKKIYQFNECSVLFPLIAGSGGYVFTGSLTKTLSLLKVCMLGCMAIDVAPPYQMALGGISSGCLSLGFHSGMDPISVAGSQKWFHEELVNEQSPVPSTSRSRLCIRKELFSW
jgi:hypothetical protein